MSRGRFLKVRVSDQELADFRDKATLVGMTVSDLVRFRLLNHRLRQTSADKERLRQLAQIGNNINQVARWANTYKATAPALEIILWLNRLTQEVASMANKEGDGNVDQTFPPWQRQRAWPCSLPRAARLSRKKRISSNCFAGRPGHDQSAHRQH